MSPNLTVGYLAEQINRSRLDGVAARGCLVEEAVATRSRHTKPVGLPAPRGAAFVRVGEWIRGTVRPAAIPTNLPHALHGDGRRMTA